MTTARCTVNIFCGNCHLEQWSPLPRSWTGNRPWINWYRAANLQTVCWWWYHSFSGNVIGRFYLGKTVKCWPVRNYKNVENTGLQLAKWFTDHKNRLYGYEIVNYSFKSAWVRTVVRLHVYIEIHDCGMDLQLLFLMRFFGVALPRAFCATNSQITKRTPKDIVAGLQTAKKLGTKNSGNISWKVSNLSKTVCENSKVFGIFRALGRFFQFLS